METNTIELKKTGKIGVMVNIAFHVAFLIYLIYLFVVFVQLREKMVRLTIFRIPIPNDVLAFFFILLPLLIGVSLYYNVQLLLKRVEYQNRAIVFSFLSGSVIGALLLIAGRAPLDPYELPEAVKQKLPSLKKAHQRVGDMPLTVAVQSQHDLLLKYEELRALGLITDEEYDRIRRRLSDNNRD